MKIYKFYENPTCVDKCKYYWYILFDNYYCTVNDMCYDKVNNIEKYDKLEKENNN